MEGEGERVWEGTERERERIHYKNHFSGDEYLNAIIILFAGVVCTVKDKRQK